MIIKNILKKEKGSIALISILIISAILIIISVGMSDANISTSYQYLNKESDQNLYVAGESCFEETVLRIKNNISFAGTTLVLGDINCTSEVSGDLTKDINIEVTYLNYTQNFHAQISVTTNGQAINVSLLKWEEI